MQGTVPHSKPSSSAIKQCASFVRVACRVPRRLSASTAGENVQSRATNVVPFEERFRILNVPSIYISFLQTSYRYKIETWKYLHGSDHRGIRHRVLTNQRDRSYVYAVVSLAAGGPFVGGPIVTYIFSRVA